MQVNAVLKARHPRTYRPPHDRPPDYYRHPGKLKRGRPPLGSESMKAKIEAMRERLRKHGLPGTWAKPIAQQALNGRQLKELLARATSLKQRLDDLRLELRRFIHGGTTDGHQEEVEVEIPELSPSNKAHRGGPSSAHDVNNGLAHDRPEVDSGVTEETP